MSRNSIDMAQPGGRQSRIIVDTMSDRMIEVTFLRDGKGSAKVQLPPIIALRLSQLLLDAARATQQIPTPAQQAEQAAACPCRGADDMCPCQNVVPIR